MSTEIVPAIRFDRRELAGSLGDLGTLLPIAIGLVLVCGIQGTPLLLAVGAYYIATGLIFRTTVPVQPMKVIGAYAIARALGPEEITAAGMWIGVLLLVLAATGAVQVLARITPKAVIRGVQLTTGMLLLTEGVRFIAGTSRLQAIHGSAEPFLFFSSLGPVPIGILIGGAAVILLLLLLENRVAPAGLVVVLLGAGVGLALGGYRGLADFHLDLHLPTLLPYGLPDGSVLTVALVSLALPQLPMTLGNAIIAQADLTREYFGEEVAARANPRALAVSMGLANVISALIGGMPMCHGAGGLAAHYRFGARTAGSNLFIGGLFIAAGLVVGDQAANLLGVFPFSALGAMLVFAGAQLALQIRDVTERADLF
ncbi:MAG: putative sulfate/molybdate transporter, partial [Deltaproteobacteria bacterium]|nr:putative sulfate/molybdate transporter [Deltaproteobacteria bacterium]